MRASLAFLAAAVLLGLPGTAAALHVHRTDVESLADVKVYCTDSEALADCVIVEADLDSAVRKSAVIFIAVGTPQSATGHANLDYVRATANGIAKAMDGFKVIVIKSTVPVGTADQVRQWIAKETVQPFAVVSNPEFMKEGAAVEDFMKPDRVVLGGDNGDALELVKEIYEPFVRTGNPIL